MSIKNESKTFDMEKEFLDYLNTTCTTLESVQDPFLIMDWMKANPIKINPGNMLKLVKIYMKWVMNPERDFK